MNQQPEPRKPRRLVIGNPGLGRTTTATAALLQNLAVGQFIVVDPKGDLSLDRRSGR